MEFNTNHQIQLFGNHTTCDKIKFWIRPGEPYSTFDRMFLMFDRETWIAISITLVIGLIAIHITD